MRAIKFRQAIFSRGKFHSWHYWGFLSGGNFASPETGSSCISEAWERSQQFTGLKDKNGKEIYEGDIVQWNKPHGSKAEVKFGKWSNGLEFEAHDSGIGWYVEFIHEGESNISSLEPERIEVIGNIYENPELIGSK